MAAVVQFTGAVNAWLNMAIVVFIAGQPLCERLFDALVISWPLVLVGILGILAALWTLKDTKKAANAALLNAQAVINSERPWLLVTVESNPEGEFFFRITNKGRTPASIVSGHREMEFVVGNPSNLSRQPSYSSPMYDPPSDFLVANEKWDDHPSFNPESVIDRDGKREAVMRSEEFLCFYGQVTYRDSLAEPKSGFGQHYTRWFYRYDPRRKLLMMDGPQEYRRKT
jgi:hypothetical protein